MQLCEVLKLYLPILFQHKVSIEKDIFLSEHSVPRNIKGFCSLTQWAEWKKYGVKIAQNSNQINGFLRKEESTCAFLLLHSIPCKTPGVV